MKNGTSEWPAGTWRETLAGALRVPAMGKRKFTLDGAGTVNSGVGGQVRHEDGTRVCYTLAVAFS